MRKLSSENVAKQSKQSFSPSIIGTTEKKSQRQQSLEQTSKVGSARPLFNLISKNAASIICLKNKWIMGGMLKYFYPQIIDDTTLPDVNQKVAECMKVCKVFN